MAPGVVPHSMAVQWLSLMCSLMYSLACWPAFSPCATCFLTKANHLMGVSIGQFLASSSKASLSNLGKEGMRYRSFGGVMEKRLVTLLHEKLETYEFRNTLLLDLFLSNLMAVT